MSTSAAYPDAPNATTPGTFDPSRHLTKLSRRMRTPDGQWKNVDLDYLEVKWRLLWLRTEQPLAKVTTIMLKHEGDLCVMQAVIELPNGATGSGVGSETLDDWKDFIEKAETKALGRALATLGFGTQFCEDHDLEQEPSKRGNQRIADAPVQRPATNAAPMTQQQAVQPARSAPQSNGNGGGGGWQDRPATEPQIKAIYAIARGAQAMDDGTLEEWSRTRFGLAPNELSRRQASEAIDALKLGVAPNSAASGRTTDAPKRTQQSTNDLPILITQAKQIRAMLPKANMTEQELIDAYVEPTFGITAVDDLSTTQAETTIDALKATVAAVSASTVAV